MKVKYILSALFASTLMLSSCVEADEIVRPEGIGVKELVIKGLLFEGSTDEYSSIIDNEAGTITVQVPYYISDTEPIMGDLTQMKLEAQMPTGYTFKPSLSGIHDLSQGYRTTLYDEKGNSKSYTIYAEAVKSSASSVISAKLINSERTAVVVRPPETEGAHGQLVVAKTSSSLDGALHEVLLAVSPWATVSSPALDEATGLIDFSVKPEITVTAQNGVDKTVYDVDILVPDVKPYGVGLIACMWAKQLFKDNDEGWEEGANTSVAVVDDYLIVSNVNDFKEMLVFDRYNGKRLNVKVNCEGIPEGRIIRAITSDDANHMVGTALTSNSWMITPENVLVYVWKDGIENKPTPVLDANIKGSYFAGISGTSAIDVFCTTSCAGDMTSGNAVLTNVYRGHYGGVMMFPFVDGKPDGNCVYESAGVYASTWDASNAYPLTTSAPWSFIVHSGNGRGVVSYVPAGTGSRSITFTRPLSHWWGNAADVSTWCGTTLGLDYIEFNGMNLLAVANNNTTSGVPEYTRLYVTNIGSSPTAASFADGFIFDTREGSSVGDGNNGGPAGTGYGVNGMVSAYSYEAGRQVLGDCFGSINRMTGSVLFAPSDDGNAVQVYMLVPDQGILAYEITRYDL